MKRFLHNWLLNAAVVTVMLLSATTWSQAYRNLFEPPGESGAENALGTCPTWYLDSDGDGFGSSTTLVACSQPAGYVSNSKDCDDTNASIWHTSNLYIDMDGDTWYGGTASNVCWGATPPAGYSTSTSGLDCNDSDPLVFNNADVYIDVDGDHYTHGPAPDLCYGSVLPAGYSAYTLGKDCDDNDATKWHRDDMYVDADGDMYDGGMALQICYGMTAPMGYALTTLGSDCDDSNASINPAATEIPGNHIDENCNGEEDDAVGDFFTQLKASQCDGTLTQIYNACVAVVNTPGVTQYYYEVTNMTTSAIQHINVADPYFQLTDLASYDYETTYAIRTGMDVGGVWQGYGAVCHVTTPSLSTGAAAIVIPECGTTLPNRFSPIFATGPGFINSFQFSVTNQTTLVTALLTRTVPWFTLKMMPSIYDYNTNYSVKVRVATTGGYSAYSTPCMVSTPGAPAKAANTMNLVASLKAVAYPNPFNDGFSLNLPQAPERAVQVKVYDMFGRLVESRDLQPADVGEQKLGKGYMTGVYNVIVTQDGTSESLRVIKR